MIIPFGIPDDLTCPVWTFWFTRWIRLYCLELLVY